MLKLSVLTLATVICDENFELNISVLKYNFAILKNFENCALPKISVSDGAFLTQMSVNLLIAELGAGPSS